MARPVSPSRVGRARSEVFQRPRLAASIRREQGRFGKRIRSLRMERGLSQMALAELVGVHLNSINKIELGDGNPTLATVVALGEALGVSVRELFPDA